MRKNLFFRINRPSLVGLILMSLSFGGCASLFTENSSGPRPRERDVPFQARKDKLGEPRRRVMVLPFLDLTHDHSEGFLNTARQTLVYQLTQTDQIIVIDNKDFPKELSLFKHNDEYDLREISKIAYSMGITAVIDGAITEVKAKRLGDQVGLIRRVKALHEATVRIKVMGSKIGREVFNETRSAQVESMTTLIGKSTLTGKDLEEDPMLVKESITKALTGVVPTITNSLKKLSWEGRVAMVSGDRIYLNAGRASGLQVGDILRVMDAGEDVYDPESGEMIGTAPGRMKGTLEIVNYFGKDGAAAVVHSGAGFKENDQVELY